MENTISKMKPGEIIQFSKPKSFEFVKSLKAGGTGKTVLMRDTTINEQFVCKKYDPQQKEYEDEFYERFIDEIKIMYSVFNDNIVRIFDYYLYPDLKTGYIIMEYIQGQDIDEYFQVNNKENINSVFVQTINAFSYLEKHKILHRDVRASNVIIDNSGTVKIIDFGFGKKINSTGTNEQASVLLNWPASKIPNEIWSEVYDGKTEIFYVGYMFKNLIDKYNINCFKYGILLEKMINVDQSKRIESFEEIQSNIATQTFEDVNFSHKQKNIYQYFAISLSDSIKNINGSLVTEKDISVIIEKMRIILRDNSLEEYVLRPNDLISCFIKSGYAYFPKKRIEVNVVKDFYDFFVSQTDVIKNIILNNLYGRLGNIPVVYNVFDDELPFS